MPHSLSSAPGASTVTLTPPKVIKQKRSILAMREADVDQVERSLNMTRSQMSRENADPIWAERHSQWMDIYETDAMKAYGNGTLREMVTEAGGDLDIDVVDGSMKSSVAAWYLATAHGQSDTATEVFTKLCERESPSAAPHSQVSQESSNHSFLCESTVTTQAPIASPAV